MKNETLEKEKWSTVNNLAELDDGHVRKCPDAHGDRAVTASLKQEEA